MWRTLGAGKKLLRTTLWCEFAMLGFVSGLVAAIGAETALAGWCGNGTGGTAIESV